MTGSFLKPRLSRIFWGILAIQLFQFSAGALDWPESLRFGVAEFRDAGVSPAYRYLGTSIPGELLKIVEQNSRHYLSEDEASALAAGAFVRERETILRQIGRLRSDRDALFFDLNFTPERQQTLDQNIRTQEELLRKLEEDYKDLPEAPELLPFTFPQENSAGGLLPPVAGSPEYFKNRDLDFLLWGTLEELEGILLITGEVYSFLENRRVFSFRQALRPEELPELFPMIEKDLRDYLLGGPWGDLFITVIGVTNAEIRLDRERTELHRMEVLALDPGEHLIELRAPGYLPLTEKVELLPGERKYLEYTLVPSAALEIPIISVPEGADIYFDSRWVGTTPATVAIPQSLSRILLRKEGYLDYSYFLEPREEKRMVFFLAGETSRREDYRKLRRNNFYSSLGAFFLSIPVSVYAYSAYASYSQNYSLEVSRSGYTQEALRLSSLSNLFYYGYWGSIGINGILFVNLVLDAVEYVKSSGQDFRAPAR